MLRYIPPFIVEDAWPIIAPGLAKVTNHGCDPDLADQVKRAISLGAAHLFVAFVKPDDCYSTAIAERYAGFVVIRPEESFTGNKSLHVWAAYSEGSGIDERMAEIEAMAREQGFTQVTFSSTRKGWARRMKDFQPTYTIFRKVLDGR